MRRMITDKLTKNIKEIVAAYQAGEIGAKVEVANITAIDGAILTDLKAGDIVVKQTGDMRHTYVVTYKEENKGICLSYFDASVAETVSYDYVTNAWVYNSTDVTPLGGGGSSYTAGTGIDITNNEISIDNTVALKTDIPAAQVNADWNATSGVAEILNKPTIPDAVSGTNDGTNWTTLTIGNVTKNIPQGGGGGGSATLYRHHIQIFKADSSWNAECVIYADIINSDNTAISSLDTIKTILKNGTGISTKGVLASGVVKDGTNFRNIIEIKWVVNVQTSAEELQGLYEDTSNVYTLTSAIVIPTDADVTDVVYTL